MSRGMGKTQRAVLEGLKHYGGHAELYVLVCYAYHRDDWEAGKFVRFTRAEYVATQRAVHKLREAGLVETREGRPWYTFDKHTRFLQVRLSVDTIPKKTEVTTLKRYSYTPWRGRR